MSKHVACKTIWIVSVIFIMCPKRSMPMIDQGFDEFQPNLYPSSEINFDTQVNKFIQITQENEHSTAEEPGFNYTSEEIKRLKIWPKGIVPFYIDIISFDKVLRDRIRSLLNSMNLATRVRFTELLEVPRYVFFTNRGSRLACSEVNYKKFTDRGAQIVVLGYHCLSYGDLAGVVLAILGIPPQHNAPNRDDYITVQEENILPGKEHLFQKLKNNEWLFHDLPYDFYSAGHFGYHKYTAGGYATIKLKNNSSILTTVGEPQTFTGLDILKVKMAYNYISLKSGDDSLKIPCSKLFKPGKDLKDGSVTATVELQPRDKPQAFY